MINRVLAAHLLRAAEQRPVVAVTGPRQSGKTTLCRAVFGDHQYVSLEPLDIRDWARDDPRGFLAAHDGDLILDEVQRVPTLFSYLQERVDEDPEPGRIILTGSQHFGLTEAISQSLAGRIALLNLLPFSHDEHTSSPNAPQDLWATVWTGGYPRIHEQGLDPGSWLTDYIATYIQRDVRQVLDVNNLDAFTAFLRLLAGRTAQELNLSDLGADAGVSHNTARSWLSVLEASFVIFRLPAWHRNVRKRVIKAPKIHFVDTGLACNLLGIRQAGQLETHPLRGALFESWVASEVLKARLHRGLQPDMSHLREKQGTEIDLLIQDGQTLTAVEMKSGATVATGFTRNLQRLAERAEGDLPDLQVRPRLLYGGASAQTRGEIAIIPWSDVAFTEWD